MKSFNNKAILAATLATMGGMAYAQNTGALLSSNGSLLNIGSSSTTTTAALPTVTQGSNPSMNMVVGGGTLRNAFSGFWYYRVSGDIRERNLANATSRTLTGTNEVTWGFSTLVTSVGTTTATAAVAGVTASRNDRLFGAVDGNSAYWFSDLDITNGGTSDLTIDLFFVHDMDLAGTFGNDVVAPLEIASGRRTWNVTDTVAGGWNMKYTGFGATGAGVGAFSAINTQMTDAGIDNFADLNAGGLAAGDYAEAMQWSFTIGAGQTSRASGVVAVGKPGVNLDTVPEPTTMAALGLGVAAFMRRRNKK